MLAQWCDATTNFRKREWRRILKRAAIGHRALKDLRDTFSSQLLTAEVQLGYVSVQLGHADVSVTARHYAQWIEGDRYRAPMVLEPGELPAVSTIHQLAYDGRLGAARETAVVHSNARGTAG